MANTIYRFDLVCNFFKSYTTKDKKPRLVFGEYGNPGL